MAWVLMQDEKFKTWLDSLTLLQAKIVASQLVILEIRGNTLRLPHSRALGAGLFELREQKFGYRIYYRFIPEQRIIVLQGGDKNSQSRDIKIAHVRSVTYAKI